MRVVSSHLTGASAHLVGLGMRLRRQGLQRSAKLDQVSIAILPLLQQVEVADNLVNRGHPDPHGAGSRRASPVYTPSRPGFLASLLRQTSSKLNTPCAPTSNAVDGASYCWSRRYDQRIYQFVWRVVRESNSSGVSCPRMGSRSKLAPILALTQRRSVNSAQRARILLRAATDRFPDSLRRSCPQQSHQCRRATLRRWRQERLDRDRERRL